MLDVQRYWYTDISGVLEDQCLGTAHRWEDQTVDGMFAAMLHYALIHVSPLYSAWRIFGSKERYRPDGPEDAEQQSQTPFRWLREVELRAKDVEGRVKAVEKRAEVRASEITSRWKARRRLWPKWGERRKERRQNSDYRRNSDDFKSSL